jgi:hypothetical protein
MSTEYDDSYHEAMTTIDAATLARIALLKFA